MPDLELRPMQSGDSPRLLTDLQARELRLSSETNEAAAQRLGVSVALISKCRSGATYGSLQPDEIAAQKRRAKSDGNRYRPMDNLLMFGPHYLPGLADQDPVEALDANNECSHGRLPTDRTPPCGCFPQELLKTSPIPTPRRNKNHEHDHRLARLAAQAARVPPDPNRSAVDRSAVSTGRR